MGALERHEVSLVTAGLICAYLYSAVYDGIQLQNILSPKDLQSFVYGTMIGVQFLQVSMKTFTLVWCRRELSRVPIRFQLFNSTRHRPQAALDTIEPTERFLKRYPGFPSLHFLNCFL
jgi:hypothetical protein